jgi:hypothetical protein
VIVEGIPSTDVERGQVGVLIPDEGGRRLIADLDALSPFVDLDIHDSTVAAHPSFGQGVSL